MISPQVLEYLKLVHGLFNTVMMFLFMHHGWLGLKIRKKRKPYALKDFTIIRSHRQRGPVLVLTGLFGFLAGVSLVYLDKGHIVEFPAHFITGSSLAFLLILTFLISRKIKGPESLWRNIHYVTGLGILCLYLLQVFLGLSVLL